MEKTDVGEKQPFRCPFCHDDVDATREVWIACGACLARHHSECWFEANACSSCKNPSPLVPVERPVRVRGVRVEGVHRERRRDLARRRRWLLGFVLAVLVFVNLACLLYWFFSGSTGLPFSYNGF